LFSFKAILKALLVSLFVSGIAYGVSKLNVFGIETASDRAADGAYQRVFAPSYGSDRKGQKQVSVVYLDDLAMDNLKGVGWNHFPPTMDQQWTMVDDVLHAAGKPPTAIFVDFLYLGESGDPPGFPVFLDGLAKATHAERWRDTPACVRDPLIRLSCIVAAGGVPVILAKPGATDMGFQTETQKKLDAVTVLAPALVNKTAYPLVTQYPDLGATQKRALGVHDFDLSPAAAVYAAWMLSQAKMGEGPFGILRRQGVEALAGKSAPLPDMSADFGPPLDVVWGSRPDPDHLRIVKQVSGKLPNCRGVHSRSVLARFVDQLAVLRGPAQDARQECPYTLSLAYDRLVSTEGLQQSDIDRALSAKLVLVGGQFRTSNDWVESPVQGQVPGVHYHAMALDNLVEFGRDYRRNVNFTLFDSDLLKTFLIFGLTFFGALLLMYRNCLVDSTSDHEPPGLRFRHYAPCYVLLFVGSIGLVVMVTVMGVELQHGTPINWIGVGFVVIGFLISATFETLPSDVAGSLRRFHLTRRLAPVMQDACNLFDLKEERLLKPASARTVKPPPPQAADPLLQKEASNAQT
jgi:hypothetical protein